MNIGMFCCGGVRERRDGAQVNLKAHALQLISTLAALIVEPPRADAASEARTAARLHVGPVCLESSCTKINHGPIQKRFRVESRQLGCFNCKISRCP